MKHIASGVVKHRKMIILIALFLLIPAVIGILNTRINYDVLVYLPDNIQTVQGQNILKKDFGTGGISMANASQDYTTFTKLSNNTKGTVKFLYRTDAIGE